MESILRKWWHLQLGCLLMVNLIYGNLEYINEAPASLGEIDHHCWETSSHRLVAMKNLRVEGTVIVFWELMKFLKESSKPKHNDLFNNLAQNFWDVYIDCVLSRSHGLGRRQLEAPELFLAYSPKTSEGFTNLNLKSKKQEHRRYLNK